MQGWRRCTTLGEAAIADKLTSQDGANAVGKLDAAHEHTKGSHQMNDHVESNFGCYDLVSHMFRYTTVENLSGIAQQMRNQVSYVAISVVISNQP